MKKGFFLTSLTAALACAALDGLGQCKSYTSITGERSYYEVEVECAKQYSDASYLSDGHDYRTRLSGKNSEKYTITFYGGNRYRIIACTDLKGGVVLFSLHDNQGNKLFSNQDQNNAPAWDLVFKSTIEAVLTLQLSDETIALAVKELGGTAKKEVKAAEASKDTGDAAVEAPQATGPSVCVTALVAYKQE